MLRIGSAASGFFLDTELAAVRDSAGQIDKLLGTTSMGPTVDGQWAKVKTEPATISKAFGVEDATPTETPAK